VPRALAGGLLWHTAVDPRLRCWAGGSGGQYLAEYRIRETLEVVSNGAGVQRGPATQRALLAIVRNADQIVFHSRLIVLIWGDRAPRRAARSIQICVSELRGILSQFRTPGSFDALGARRVVDVRVDAHRLGGVMGGSWHRAQSGGSGRG
jgi:hypothetical protein